MIMKNIIGKNGMIPKKVNGLNPNRKNTPKPKKIINPTIEPTIELFLGIFLYNIFISIFLYFFIFYHK